MPVANDNTLPSGAPPSGAPGGGGLDPRFRVLVDQFIGAVRAETGIDLRITSGYRTRAQQEAIYATARPGYAARPGNSMHERGLAIDVATSTGTMEELRRSNPDAFDAVQRIAGQLGMRSGMSFSAQEPWHFDMRGASEALDRVAGAATAAGVAVAGVGTAATGAAAAVTAGGDQELEVYRRLYREQKATERQGAVAAAVYQIDQQTAATRRLAEATLAGGAALREAEIRTQALAQAEQLGIDSTEAATEADKRQYEQILQSTQAARDQADALAAVQRIAEMRLDLHATQAQAGLIGLTGADRAAAEAILKTQDQINRDRQRGVQISEDAVSEELRLAEATARTGYEVQKLDRLAT